jgi:hypothetical protein
MVPLTIGMSTFDDFHGTYFTIQSLRLYHDLTNVEILVIDNNPDSDHGVSLRKLINGHVGPNGPVKDSHLEGVRYIPYRGKKSTSVRNLVFDRASNPYVACVDCHALFSPKAIENLRSYYSQNPDTKDLLHGVMLHDNLTHAVTHMSPEWDRKMFGKWGVDPRGSGIEPFEIEMHGMGFFSCAKKAWLRFPSSFEGFGGEEGYIHEKFRQAGRRIWCLPNVRWLHRFPRPDGVPYPLTWDHRFKNYLIGFMELGMEVSEVFEEFRSVLSPEKMESLMKEAKLCVGK